MSTATEFVLDNSVTMVWGFDDEADPYAGPCSSLPSPIIPIMF